MVFVSPRKHMSRIHIMHTFKTLVHDAWMASQLNVALIRTLHIHVRGSLMCLAYIFTCYPWKIVQPGTGRRPVDWCRN